MRLGASLQGLVTEMPLGHNIIPDAGFDDSSKWVKNTGSGQNIVEVVNSSLHIVNLVSGANGFATPSVNPAAVVNAWYDIRALVTVVSGVGRISWGGAANSEFSSSGYKSWRRQATTTNAMTITKTGITGNFYVHWVSIRREDIGMSKLVLTMRDFDGDKRQTSIEMGAISDGTSYGTVSAQMAALATAIDAVTAGNIARQQYVSNDTEPNDTNAANLVAQTAYRWIIEYVDAVTGDGPYQIDIPTPDLADNTLVLSGSNQHDPANAEWVTLKAAMEGGEVKNPRTGNNISITAIFLEQ